MSPADTLRSSVEQADPDVLSTAAAGPLAVRGGTLRVLGYVVGALLAAGSAALLFRHLGVTDTGRYVLVLSLVAIVAGVSDLGLTAIGVREMAVREHGAREALSRNLMGLRGVLTLAGLAIALVFAAAVGYPSVVVTGVVMAGAGSLLQNLQGTLAINLQSRLRLGSVAALDLLRQVGTVALIVALVVADAHLPAFLIIPIPVGALVLVITVWLVRGKVPLRPSLDWAEWRALIRDTLPYAMAVIAATLYFRVTVIVVSLLASATALGYFNASYRVIEAVVGVPQLLVGAALPIFARAARDQRERLAYAVSRVFEASLIVGVWFTVVLVVGAPLAIKIIGGSKFAPAATILAIQGVAVAGSSVGIVWSTALLSLGRHRDILRINLTALGLGTALAVLLVALDGARGGAIATAAAEVSLAIMGYVVVRHADSRLAPGPTIMVKVAIAGGCACAIGLWPGADSVVLVALGTGIYWGLLLALRAVPAELRDALPFTRR